MKALLIALWGLCPTEDATNCVWDAKTQGNGEGISFLALDVPGREIELLLLLGSY